MISGSARESIPIPSRAIRQKRFSLRLGFCIAVLLVFAAQIGLVFLLGDPAPVAPLRPSPSTIFHFNTQPRSELLALQDPTLFLLPHRDNFSGAAWLDVKPQSFAPESYNSPSLPLPLAANQLGAAFTAFMQSNPPPRFQSAISSESSLMDPPVPPIKPISIPGHIVVEGGLANRLLLTPVDLPAQTNSDLQDTVIQLLVNPQGQTFSPVVLQSCGNSVADDTALNFAKNARFEPIPEAPGNAFSDRLLFGTMTFEWQSVLPSKDNQGAAP